MEYSAEISRLNPSCFLFLLDQSGSMADPFGGGDPSWKKANAVADAINRLLQNLVIKCTRDDGPRDYFNVGVIGYGAQVGSAFGGNLAGRELVPISDVANMPTRLEARVKKVEDGAGGLVDQSIRFPVWLDPIANGGTPMCQALGHACKLLQGWLAQHPDCYPPIVINITDGESTDGDPSSMASDLRQLRSSNGNVLLFNLHLSSLPAQSIEYPDSEVSLPDKYSQLLFGMSSTLTPHMRNLVSDEGCRTSEGTRGFVFNADIVSVIRFLDIGTTPSDLR